MTRIIKYHTYFLTRFWQIHFCANNLQNCLNPKYVSSAIFKYFVFRLSTDEGQCWKTYNFTELPLFIAGLASEPGTKSLNISVFGYRPEDDDQPMWVAVTIDFEHLLTRECKKI